MQTLIPLARLAAVALISSLAISAILCAPSQQQQQQQASSPSSAASSSQSTATSKSTTSAPKLSATNSNNQQLSSAASVSNGSPSIVKLSSEASSPSRGSDEMDAFDGKNPFTDDSLWQIPVHLVRDLSEQAPHNGATSATKETLAKSASETSAAAASDDDNDDDDDAAYGDAMAHLLDPANGGSPAQLQQSSSTLPAVISASTTGDLKTAAGYHYPTHGGGHHAHSGYGGDQSAASYGGHGGSGHHGYGGGYHGGDHYGKYFQYASVPYPGAWEFGYRRGNPYHTIERHEHGKGPHFQTKVKWSDKHGGYGVHVWDYNHDDHHSHHYGGGGHYDSHHSPSHYGGGHHGGHHGGHYGHH